ncbi:MAG TPA: DedA family protein [Candidatus Micrarchaeaceae archaeon]|nr:DedA family protein [Candidatus Micrarchaeaceae archaeon]
MSEAAEPETEFGLSARWRVIGGIGVLIAVIVIMWLLVEHDASGELPSADGSIGAVLRDDGYLVGFALIYIEESGPPLFIPGDAFVLYVGHRLPHNFPVLFAAWLGFTLAVTLGATNLYLVSRRYGRRLLQHRIARVLELTPSRLDRAEAWFARFGPWTLVFGRHIPGFRVPLTVAAGILKLRYRVFAISVAVSSAAWAAVFLLLGVLFGDRLERSIRSSPLVYGGGAALIIVAIVGVGFLRSRRNRPLEEQP